MFDHFKMPEYFLTIWCYLQVVFGENGILDAMQAGKAFVDMTTVDIGTITGVSEVSSLYLGITYNKLIGPPIRGEYSSIFLW